MGFSGGRSLLHGNLPYDGKRIGILMLGTFPMLLFQYQRFVVVFRLPFARKNFKIEFYFQVKANIYYKS